MKAISYIVASIIMLIITIALTGTAYLYISGYFSSSIQGIEITDSYCSKGEVIIKIKNIGTDTITSLDVEQTSPAFDILEKQFQGTIEPGKSITYTDVCEGEKSRTCTYSISPPAAKTIPANIPCADKPDSLVLALSFDEGSGNIAYDSSRHENDGMLKPDPYSLVFVEDNGALPWGSRPNIPSTADWIWKNSDAEVGAPIESFWVIKKFDLSTPTSIRLNITVDNYADVYVDDTFLGSDTDWTITTSWIASLSSGTHYLRLKVGNTDGPAGLVASFEAPIGNIQFLTQEDGTWIIGPTWVDGKFGKALSFDGVDDYVDCGNDTSLDITGDITIEAWIKPASAQEYCWDGVKGNYGVMAKANKSVSGTVWSWQLRYGAPGDSNCYLGFQFNGDPEGSRWVTVGQNLIPGEWYHVAGIFDGTTIKSYLNGVKIEENHISGIHSSIAQLLIGEEGWQNYFDGTIDEIRIYNKAII